MNHDVMPSIHNATGSLCDLVWLDDVKSSGRKLPNCRGGSEMYQFAVVALLALATLKVVDFICDNVAPLAVFRSLLTDVAGIGSVLWLDFSLFDEWNIDVRNHDIG